MAHGIEHGLSATFMEGTPEPKFLHLGPRHTPEYNDEEERRHAAQQGIGGIAAVGQFYRFEGNTSAQPVAGSETLDVDPRDAGWAD